jgi:integrase
MTESLGPPRYRHYRPKDLAVVRIAGKDYYLGRFDSPESWERYHRLLAEKLYGTLPPLEQSAAPTGSIQVKELALRFFDHAEGYYQRDGQPTSELTCIRMALRRLLKLYGELPAAEFSPQKLKLVREEFIRDGNCRSVVNQNISRIRRMFRWAVENELIPVTVYQALATVAGLRKGRSTAREPEPVQPVDDAAVEASLPFMAPQVQAMVRLQRLSGCRPGEIAALRPCDLDKSCEVWCYRPASHKTQHHGTERRIYFGPRAQEILRPWLGREPGQFCFSPKEAEEMRRATLHGDRKTPLHHGNRPGTNRKKNPKRTPGERYNAESYRRAIERACRLAKIEPWSPNQLRHTRASELRRFHGLDAAQVVLGHSQLVTTQVYAERDHAKAEAIMRLCG